MDPGQLASLAMLAGLIVDKALARFNVNLYDGVKHLHCGCSSCMDIDIDRSKTPPTTPTTTSARFEPLQPTTAAPQPLPQPTAASSEVENRPSAPIVRRLSIPENLSALASHPDSS